jgi:hypothetical protein
MYQIWHAESGRNCPRLNVSQMKTALHRARATVPEVGNHSFCQYHRRRRFGLEKHPLLTVCLTFF